MIKFVVLAAVLSVLCRWALGRWPWDFLKPRPTRGQAVFRARIVRLQRSADDSANVVFAKEGRIEAVAHEGLSLSGR